MDRCVSLDPPEPICSISGPRSPLHGESDGRERHAGTPDADPERGESSIVESVLFLAEHIQRVGFGAELGGLAL